jgi:hypothetical protein
MKANRTLILSTLLIVIFYSCTPENPTPNPPPPPTPTSFTIGQSYQGGIIIYNLQSWDMGYDANVPHGLIAATSDQSVSIQWGCWGVEISGTSQAIGNGNQNTIDIINGCSEPDRAARLCGDLVLGGYSDWYLPSLDELNKMYIAAVTLGYQSFPVLPGYYWSSSEMDDPGGNHQGQRVWVQNLNSGSTNCEDKTDFYPVRAVRSF